ncbi:MAG: TRAP transporter substrate-binding protein DctP [Pseudomonadota bacterium]|nr:TRAP transporter substrate-binding protein DctP [Pseudomonadota bacterium]
MKININVITGITLILGFVLASTFSSKPANSVDLLINNYLPPKHPFQVAIQGPWAKAVKAATKGSVTPKFSAAAVGPAPKNWQTVTKGIADVVLLANIFQRKRIQLPTVSEFPLSSPGALKTSRALWATHEKFFKKANEYKGTHLVGSFVLTPNIIHSLKKPLKTVADLKGIKTRASPGLAVKVLNALGAVPVASGPFKIFTLASTGVVDAVSVPAHGLFAFKIMPYVKYTTRIKGGLTNTSFSFLINGKKWDGLSKTQQNQIMSVSGMAISNKGSKTDKIAAGALNVLKKKGGKVIEPDPSLVKALTKISAASQNNWLKKANAKGIDGKAALAFFKSQIK